MLTFKNTSIAVATVILVMIAWDLRNPVPWYYYAVVLLVYLSLLTWGSMQVASGFYLRTFNKRVTRKKQIAITFDDGPAENYTSGILNHLNNLEVPAAFFCIGKNIAGREQLMKRIVDEGHIIGNHSYSHHFWFDLYSASRMKEDLRQMNDAAHRATGFLLKLFRPPYGVTNPNLAKAVSELGLIPIGWNLRSMDTVVKDHQKLLQTTLRAVKPGGIVLFHDTSEATFLMLPAFIEEVRRLGFEIVRLDKLLGVEPYEQSANL